MQYTGIKDKNGKEIYEGDILKCEGIYGRTSFFGEIVWESSSFRMHCKEKFNDFLVSWVGGNGSKIIGNIYENPELLNEK